MKPLNRHISMPVTFMGMDGDDLVVCLSLVGVVGILGNQVGWGLALGTICLFVLKRIKRGRPRGIVVQVLYHLGGFRHWLLPPPPRLTPRLSLRPERLDWSVRGGDER